jgi:ATP-binding cassette, subfamily C, bacterial LapB
MNWIKTTPPPFGGNAGKPMPATPAATHSSLPPETVATSEASAKAAAPAAPDDLKTVRTPNAADGHPSSDVIEAHESAHESAPKSATEAASGANEGGHAAHSAAHVQERAQLAKTFVQWMRLKGQPVPSAQAKQHLAAMTVAPSARSHDALRSAHSLGEAVCSTARFVTLKQPQLAALPLLCPHPDLGWLIVTGRDARQLWRCVDADGVRHELVLDGVACLHLVAETRANAVEQPTARGMMLREIRRNWPVFGEAAGLSLVLAAIGISISFYSMQVYDRVIPSQGHDTLWVLTMGVGLAILIEWLLKLARATLLEPRLKQLDVSISQALLARLNSVRMDQRPGSVGTLASQMQSFESIRSILSTSTLFLLFDMPMAILFALVIGMIGGFWMAAPAVLLFGLTLLAGVLRMRKISRISATHLTGANAKTGLLVETIEGAESIKGLGAQWRFEARWAALSESNADQSLALKHETDATSYLAAGLQQASYISLICIGAVLAIGGDLTQGAIIACSILSGRVLSPLASIPGLLVQLGNAKASMKSLDAIFRLETDNHDVERPLVPEAIRGDILFDDVEFAYPGSRQSMRVGRLQIRAGEKVAIIGGIGAGKSTLLSMACGQSKPTKGTVYLDGVDQQQIHAGWRSAQIAYCPQNAWLFAGTLRENLAFGLTDVSDEQLIIACQRTGLWPMVSSHPMGLDRKLTEGGRGLSGGQRQLVALTRLVLAERSVWLLDEPTSGMDDGLEHATVQLLKQQLAPTSTLLLVTHRLSMLRMVDRVIVLSPQGVMLDGPRDQVLAQLQGRPAAAPGAAVSAIKAPAGTGATTAAATASNTAIKAPPAAA